MKIQGRILLCTPPSPGGRDEIMAWEGFQGKGRRGREREEEGKELRVREGAKGKGRIEEEMR